MRKKILVSGCNGHMGKLIVKAINATANMFVVSGFDNSIGTEKYPIYSNINLLYSKCQNELLPDAIIDFSSPKATQEIAKFAFDNKIPIVIATTGLTTEDIMTLKDFSNCIPIFQTYNMSYGIAILKKVLKIVSKQLCDSDIEIIETHHNRKKDCPSGTAKMLANTINQVYDNTKRIVYGHEGLREKHEIGISSIRGGNIVGEHIVQFFSDCETIEFKHVAYSREVFVNGAIQALKFLLTKKTGFYDMEDLINSNFLKQ